MKMAVVPEKSSHFCGTMHSSLVSVCGKYTPGAVL